MNVYKVAETFPLDVFETTSAELEPFKLCTSFTYYIGGHFLVISATAEMGNLYQLMYNVDTNDRFRFEQEVPIPPADKQIALGYETFFFSTNSE